MGDRPDHAVEHGVDALIPIPPRRIGADCVAALLLACVVLVAHGGSLFDGLFFDDHWHRAMLRIGGWGWDDLIESATFELPGRLAHLWWQEQPLQWRYARPVAMLFMKLEYVLSGGDPVVIHAFGLFWHWLCTLLVYGIARWALPPEPRGLALLAAALFVLHPQSVFGVSWIAARNAPVSAFFFLAAFHFYARGSLIGRSVRDGYCPKQIALAVMLWVLALLSRETAIIFPLLVPLLDLGFGGRRIVRQRLPVYAVLGVLLGGYLYWRLLVFPTGGPPGIYFTAPQGMEYAVWAFSKLLHMLFAHIVHTPMFLGLATYSGVDGRSLIEHGAMFLIVALLLGLYSVGSRGVRGRWTWPCWTALAFVPVIPVFVMPHFSYLPAAATAIMIPLMLHRLRCGWRAAAIVFVVAYAAWPLLIYRYAWRGIARSEQVVYEDVLSQSARPTAAMFFLNLPVCGIYGAVAMREAWQRDDIEGHVLTFAPHPLMMRQPSTIERLSDREFTISTPPPGYFSGLSGAMLHHGMRPRSSLNVGTVVDGELFDTTVLEADERGITKLKFTFDVPLDSPEYSFYLCTPEHPARKLDFAAENWSAAGVERSAAHVHSPVLDSMLRERANYFRIVDIARRFIRSNLYLTGDEQ
jgi:hypothetical protein